MESAEYLAPRRSGRQRIWTIRSSRRYSKQEVEIHREPPAAVSEEKPICRIGHIAVYGLRIEMIRQIESAHRKPHRVFRIHLDILRYAHVHRQEIGEPAAVRHAHIRSEEH